ncbi:BolA family transcriptional regulator [Nisaea acidiphila]|uniref:BolA family transcriptional regulator n=1 Tax=Nisaea acidiphila TaxID=1862145 RepID=A0A9J7AZJ7_9PROT|nr:BolA family protein [Nisaea acidiphila]UUX51676.1 BolA family transcriptional regulator [Nisaea acidiphila]
MSVTETIKAKLTSAFAPEHLAVIDDSQSHRGHGGWREGGETHFNVEIVSDAFSGKSRVDRQRMVHEVLAEELAGRVHALSIKAKSPAE